MSAFRFNQSVTESSGQKMDPADPTSLAQALNAQGALMGRHDQMLQQIMKALQALTANITQLGQQVTVLSAQPPAQVQPNPLHPRPKSLLFHHQSIIQATKIHVVASCYSVHTFLTYSLIAMHQTSPILPILRTL